MSSFRPKINFQLKLNLQAHSNHNKSLVILSEAEVKPVRQSGEKQNFVISKASKQD